MMTDQQETTTAAPYFEDVLLETGTKRDDWVIGVAALAKALDRDSGGVSRLLSGGSLQGTRVKVFRGPEVWIVRKTVIAAFKQAHAEEKEKKTSPYHQGNGAVPAAAATVVLKEGMPILAKQDAENIARGLWDNKLATQANTAALERLSGSLDANTKAMRDQIATTIRIFEGDKK